MSDYVGPNLQNGIGTLSVQLPLNCQVGDSVSFLALVTDASRLEPFENRFAVKIQPAAPPSGQPSTRRKPPSGQNGDDREVAAGIALPNIIEVHEAEWDKQSPHFDKNTALRIKNAGLTDESGANVDAKPIYDFYINMDNLYLKTEIKSSKSDPRMINARFTYGMVLLGLALLQQDEVEKAKSTTKRSIDENGDDEPGEDDAESNIEQKVAQFTQAVAPVLLPMIESLGDLDEDQVPTIVGSGEAT